MKNNEKSRKEKEMKVQKSENLYSIIKDNAENINVKELYEILDNLVKEGKSDFELHHEGFCCGISEICISDKDKQISFD